MTEAVAAPAAPAAPGTENTAPPANELPAAPAAEGTSPANPLEIQEPAKAPEPKAEEPGEVFSYGASGDSGLDLALDFVGSRGFGPDHPAIKAAEAGDFGPLKAALTALGDKAKGWERIVQAGEDGFKRLDGVQKERATKTTAAIHEIAGGAEQWAKVQKWAGDNATPEERTAVNAALKAGGLVAKAVARELHGLYMQQPNAEQKGAPARAASAPAATVGSDALSPRQFTAEVAKLSAKLGGGMDGSREYAALKARRAAWRP